MKFSIIIPVYNDTHITECLESVLQLNYPSADYEIIVVDNNSSTDIAELIKEFPVQYMHEPITGSYKARNTGAKSARGEILAFTDSDCVVSQDWLHAIEHTLTDAKISAVMGYAAGNNQNKIAAYEQTMYEANIAAFAHEKNLRRIDTRNFAVRSKVFKQVGGFTQDLKYGGDMEYGARLHEANFSVVFSKYMFVTHTNPTNLRSLLYKRIRQNYGNMKIPNMHTNEFVKDYFPHLLQYSPSLKSTALWWIMKLWILMIFPFSHITCILLPSIFGYWYFKINNIVAMRFGQLSYILGKSI